MNKLKRIWHKVREAIIVFLVIVVFLIIPALIGADLARYMVKRQEIPHTTVTSLSDTLSYNMADSVINLLYLVRVEHPLIVGAQAVLESANFNSDLFKSNNNMFGMRFARQRPTTAIGVRKGYAYYKCWQDCVVDYALWQGSYARGLNEEQYYQKLSTYAEDEDYVSKLKQVLK